MAITIDGSANTIAGLAVGGLPNGTVTDAEITAVSSSKLSGALPAISGAALTGVGINEADNWRLTSDISANTNPLTNWERVDDTAFGKIGTGLSHSSGIFSFPSTGIWYIDFNLRGYAIEDTTMNMQLWYTVDNGSNWDDIAMASVGFGAGAGNAGTNQGSANYLMDVTNTTNCKFKLELGSVGGAGSTAKGDSAVNETHFQVIRLGDT